jgi:hypothetical protein
VTYPTTCRFYSDGILVVFYDEMARDGGLNAVWRRVSQTRAEAEGLLGM